MPLKNFLPLVWVPMAFAIGCKEPASLSVKNLGPTNPRISLGAEYRGEFEVKNLTSQRLELDDPADSCFGVSSLSKRVLEPGEAAILVLRLPAMRKEGGFLGIASLSSNESALSEIRIIGQVDGHLQSGLELLKAGSIYSNQEAKFSFIVPHRPKSGSLVFSKVPEDLKLNVVPKLKNEIQIQGSIRSPGLPGEHTSQIEFYWSETPYERFTKPISYFVKADVEAIPSSAIISAFGQDGVGRIRIELKNTDKARIISISSLCSMSKVTKEHNVEFVDAICRNPGANQYSSSELLLSTGNPKQPRVAVPISLIGTK